MAEKKSCSWVRIITRIVEVGFFFLSIWSIYLTIKDFSSVNLCSTISIVFGFALSLLLDYQQKQINKSLEKGIVEQKEDLEAFKDEPLARYEVLEDSVDFIVDDNKEGQ